MPPPVCLSAPALQSKEFHYISAGRFVCCFRYANRLLKGILLYAKPWGHRETIERWCYSPTDQIATSVGDGQEKKSTHKTACKINSGSCHEASRCDEMPLSDITAGKASLRKMRSNGNHLKLGIVLDSWNPGMLKAGARGLPV